MPCWAELPSSVSGMPACPPCLPPIFWRPSRSFSFGICENSNWIDREHRFQAPPISTTRCSFFAFRSLGIDDLQSVSAALSFVHASNANAKKARPHVWYLRLEARRNGSRTHTPPPAPHRRAHPYERDVV